MASNYELICKENLQRYGSVGAQKSGGLAAGLYDNRTHFIFELLQNAEDALGRRGEWHGPRKVAFSLTQKHLTLSHFGKPFDDADVRSVCDIAESTKNETSIGRFGLGFKSVYTVTDFPEIHSGSEDFLIENYVYPKRVDRTVREADETQIILPLKSADINAPQEITTGFRHLGPGALLFLRHIEEINWSVSGGVSGFYLRNKPEKLGGNVHRITVIGQESGQAEVDQNWLVFHRDVFSDGQKNVGRVEIAFALVAIKDASGHFTVQPLPSSPLVVFFPTVVESHLGFLVQGPYRTTPSRDNIPPGDIWNVHLVEETASLLAEAMRWMRDNAMLDVAALRCLPLDREKFSPGSRFAPMFDAVRQAFQVEALLPTFDGSYVMSKQAKLARTQDLRQLLSPGQVAALFDSEVANWLSGDLTLDKAPEIIKYLTHELDIDLITPAKLVQSLTKPFLEAQPDGWVLRLYEFLTGQEAVLRRGLDTIPLIRLEDGTHVVAHKDGEAKAFLPGAITTGFPTVRRAVCATSEARAFLVSLRITEPDPVDDVIRHILPKYRQEEVSVDEVDYAADIERIRLAFNTDSTAQKEKLRSALRETAFVMVVDAGDGKDYVAKPGDVYIATDRLKQLFSGVPNVFIVDDNYECLRGEDIRELLVACGASRYLALQSIPSELGEKEKLQIRKESGLERASWANMPEDFGIRGLEDLLELLPTLGADDAKVRAGLLWESLADLEGRGLASFYGTYRWGYSHETKVARFDAAFVRTLAETAWVHANGELLPPSCVLFESLGWKPNSFLSTKIAFKPPLIDQLAKEAGIDPAVLDLLRRDPQVVAELLSRLSTINTSAAVGSPNEDESNTDEQSDGDVYADTKDLYGDDMPDIPPGTPDPDAGDDPRSRISSGGGQGNGGAHAGPGGGQGSRSGAGHWNRAPGQTGMRPFISYVGTHSDDDGRDPDGLDQTKRMQIEEVAINFIIGLEPSLRRTPEGNPGFDLYEVDNSGKQFRWVEVKSMTGSLDDRPVGLSRRQFDCAREKGSAYWLYIVEHASDPVKSRVLRIHDPFALSRTFTFDKGWSQIARTELPG